MPLFGTRKSENGSTADTDKNHSQGYGSVAIAKPSFDWEYRNFPWYLLLRVVILLAQQVATLVLIAFEVVNRKEYLMPCDPGELGMPVATFCEYSKAYVRCFPAFALIVSIMVADRIFLYQRVYYQLLKRNALLVLDPIQPYKDPFFLILAWCFSQAFLHFVVHIWVYQELNADLKLDIQKAKSEAFQEQINATMIFYVVPAGLFLALLYSAYDIAEILLPMSKYFENDPENALDTIKGVRLVKEPAAVAVLHRGLDEGGVAPSSSEEAYETFIARASGASNEAVQKYREKTLSRWRLVSSWWPTKLLLSAYMDDDESVGFRRVWYIFSVPSAAVICTSFYLMLLILWNKLKDVAAGQYTDIAGIIVALTLILLIMAFTSEFVLKTIAYPIVALWKGVARIAA